MNNESISKSDELFQLLWGALKTIRQSLMAFCRAYVAVLDHAGNEACINETKQRVIKEGKRHGIPAGRWATFEHIGRDQLPEKLGWLKTAVASRIALLPPSDKQRLVEHGSVEIIRQDGGLVNMPLDEITAKEARRAFSSEGIVSLTAQARIVAEQNIKEPKATHDLQWEPVHSGIKVYETTEIPWRTLRRLVEQHYARKNI